MRKKPYLFRALAESDRVAPLGYLRHKRLFLKSIQYKADIFHGNLNIAISDYQPLQSAFWSDRGRSRA